VHLRIENTGKIAKADIEIKGITVIAGENDTGKSTVGKVLFCIFNSFYDIDVQINKEIHSRIVHILSSRSTYVRSRLMLDIHNVAYFIIQNRDVYAKDSEKLEGYLIDSYVRKMGTLNEHLNPTSLKEICDEILQVLNISRDEIFKTVFKNNIYDEFKMQINNVYQDDPCSKIILEIQGTNVEVNITENENIEIKNNISLNTEVIYMDDPLALDSLIPNRDRYYNNNHGEHLRAKLAIKTDGDSVTTALTEIITTKKLDSILEKLNSVCTGELTNKSSHVFEYTEPDSNNVFDIKNISTGLKTFIILKTLLQNGSLEENGTLVLDEPEIHLHPEWQLIFAEIIVLVQKEFNMHILINTHSHYFLDAIDVYSKKHGILEKCKYYLSENVGKVSTITDVSDDIEKIYDKLARPLQVLENERYKND
jgi:predicted ATPase